MRLFIILIVVFSVSCSEKLKKKKPKSRPIDQTSLYKQIVINQEQYIELKNSNWNFLEECKVLSCELRKVVNSIDSLGAIYLYFLQTPNLLIEDFNNYKKDQSFNDAIDDEYIDWISAAEDNISAIRDPLEIKNPQFILKLGHDYYKRGMSAKKFAMDRNGNQLLLISSKYYLSYLYEYKQKKEVDIVLFNLGTIRSSLWYSPEIKSRNFYFKELIRRYPDTKIAQKAYYNLEQNIHNAYTGSSGDHTPRSQIQLLHYFKQLAFKNSKEHPAQFNKIF